MRGPCRRLVICLAVGALLFASPAPADADAYDQIERRLKTTGISASLAREISRTIRDGATHLMAEQSKGGSWKGHPGQTALVALALVHTGDAKARDAAKRALSWLRRDDRARHAVRTSTYETGIMAMLLQALEPDGKMLADLYKRLGRGPTGAGYWGYKSAGESGSANLSTSQFACLGLMAAERAGVPRAPLPWRMHLDGLRRGLTREFSWGYWHAEHAGHDPVLGYPTGTFMGVADVALARETEIPAKESAAEAWYDDLWMQRNGEAALARHARWALARDESRAVTLGMAPYYSLYALEKACIFLDRKILAGIDWYERGAKLLIANQQADGAFGQMLHSPNGTGPRLEFKQPHAHTATAFALLFLLRASEVYRPITPRGVPKPAPDVKRPITGKEDAPAADGQPEAPEPQLARPPLPLAYRMLDQLEKKLRVLEMREVPALTHLLAFVERTLPRYMIDGRAIDTLHDAWVRRAEELVVRLCPPGIDSAITNEGWRLELARRALATLRHGTTRGGELLKKSLHSRVYERYGQRRCGMAYYAALFRCLRELRVPKLPQWLIAKCISPDAKQASMTVPALIELGQIHETDERVLRQLARRLLYKLRPISKNVVAVSSERALQIDALLTVLALVGESGNDSFARPGRELAAWRKGLDQPQKR